VPIDSDLNKLLLVICLQDKSKDAIAQGLPTYEDLEDLFMDMAEDKAKVESTFQLVVDKNIVSDSDIHRVMLVFDWFVANIVDPNFAWYVADKQSRDDAKATKPWLHQTRRPHPSVAIAIL
jgi:hypothetical protein